VTWWNVSSLVVTRLPARQAETLANMVTAKTPIVASMAVNQKSVRGRRNKLYGERAIFR
jgi:hypothetical protein